MVECTGFEIRRTGSPVPRVRIPLSPPVESPLYRSSPKAGLQVVDPVEFFGRMRVRGIQARSAMPYRLRLETAIVSAAPDRGGFELDPYCGRSQARCSADLPLGPRGSWRRPPRFTRPSRHPGGRTLPGRGELHGGGWAHALPLSSYVDTIVYAFHLIRTQAFHQPEIRCTHRGRR